MIFAACNESADSQGYPESVAGFVLALLLTAPLLCGPAIDGAPSGTPYVQPVTLDITAVGELPSANVTLEVLGGLLGNRVKGILEYEIAYDSDLMYYEIGFRQHYLEIHHSRPVAGLLGFGYDEMREYPFVYTSYGVVTDYWENRTPNWISRRHYPAWSGTSSWGGFLGPITPENMSDLTYAGDIVEFENLTVYFDDGTSFLVGPRVITTGVNFTRVGAEWNATYLLEVSESQGVQISGTGFTITLARAEPLSLPFIGGVLVVLALGVLAVAFRRYGRRIRSHMRKTRGPSCIEPV